MPVHSQPRPRSVRVFVSSTFRDMVEERNELMTQVWPQLRRFCRERQVELVEVDLRWGISEEQSTRRETLKLCLDEIRACRPFFIGLLGERYGWTPEDEAFTADLEEEQPWLTDLHGKSVTELEIIHGVLNDPEMAGRSFLYFRDPVYAQERGAGFLSESPSAMKQQASLKAAIRAVCADKAIPLRENYPDPRKLAKMVLQDLGAAIDAQYPIDDIPDPLTKEANDHEAFAETRRRTYIGRPDYFEALDCHASGDGPPLVLLGESGCGKSALLANWVEHWRKDNPKDFIVQHYIGGTPDSADHWRLMTRLIAEIKRWTDDPEDTPTSHDGILRDFPVWLAKARIRAERNGVRCIVVLDALNQLEDADHARLLGWLPEHPFGGNLRLVVSTSLGDALDAVGKCEWPSLRVQPLSPDERREMIATYLARFSKKLDAARLNHLASSPAAANPLYLKILLDELRVTGTYDRLDERLNEYLTAPDIPALLRLVLARYQRDYERDRPGLVSEALGLTWGARRGLSESELMELLRPAGLPRLPQALWSPLRAALEEGLVDRGGILNFAHDFLRSAVETAFVQREAEPDDLRLRLAGYFEAVPVSARSCDELPWLLWEAKSLVRLRACLLDIDRFIEIHGRDSDELRRYWVGLSEERAMGDAYLSSFELWSAQHDTEHALVSRTANSLGFFLQKASLLKQAEVLMRKALAIDDQRLDSDSYEVAARLNNLGALARDTGRPAEAEPLMRRALAIAESTLGYDHPDVAICLDSLGLLLRDTNRCAEAEPLMRRALTLAQQSFGPDHPKTAVFFNDLALILKTMNRLTEAEPLYRRALAIAERAFGPDHPAVANKLDNLALLMMDINRVSEAESLMRRALDIYERSCGSSHPDVAVCLNNLAALFFCTNRLQEAEPPLRRAVQIAEENYGEDHPNVAVSLDNLASLLQISNRLEDAEPLRTRAVSILLDCSRRSGHADLHLERAFNNLIGLLRLRGRNEPEIWRIVLRIAPDLFDQN